MRVTNPTTVTILAAVLIIAGGVRIEAEDSRVELALEVAESWLELVDQGDYARSWEEAADYFRQAVEPEQWRKVMSSGRAPLGEVVSRQLLEAKFQSVLAGAPDGDYVVIRYKTTFSNKADALETVTPMLDPDGGWRVSGYYFK